MRNAHSLPAEIEEYRDKCWHRENSLRVESAKDAERFIEQVGFTSCLTDSRQPGPSLYVAVCGRRDAVMPHNVQKDPESSLTWTIKDELLRRGRVYYGKLARGKTLFLAPKMVPYFHCIFGIPKQKEKNILSSDARSILKVLRKEWEMGTADLRKESKVQDRKTFSKALDELQSSMIVIPGEVIYQPKFTYIWTLAESRFSDELSVKTSKEIALREICRIFLENAGMTIPGEIARFTGLSRPDAGRGNHLLVKEGYAISLSTGKYILSSLS